MRAAVVIKPCVDCGRDVLSQHMWMNRPELRPGRVRGAAKGRCHGCYARYRKRLKEGFDDDGDQGPRIPEVVRLRVEQEIALGRPNSWIMAKLGVAYEVVFAVRSRLAEAVAS